MENQQQNQNNKTYDWMKNSITFRGIIVGVLVLLLLIPIGMVQDLIHERERRKEEATREISSKWGNAQTIQSIILTVPYVVKRNILVDKEKNEYRVSTIEKEAHFLPEQLMVNGTITPNIRYRGIYDVVVYNANLNISGTFMHPDFKNWGYGKDDQREYKWNETKITLGISDLRGVQENVTLDWNGSSYKFKPGTAVKEMAPSGMLTHIKLENSDTSKKEYSFNIHLDFNGSNRLNFIPLGQETNIQITSPWTNPGFDGAFLPDNRKITKDGFEADWKILELNRSIPQKFETPLTNLEESTFSINLILPVDEYQKSMRSSKYASLLIFLTFLAFFFIQLIRKIKIHPFQYLLVGFALCIFYSLLVSISEHLTFNPAYFIASIATITLVVLYVKAMLKDLKLTKIIGLILSVLYIYIFIIIQLEDFALLMGSIGLFASLAVVMYLSRNINWYSNNQE